MHSNKQEREREEERGGIELEAGRKSRKERPTASWKCEMKVIGCLFLVS